MPKVQEYFKLAMHLAGSAAFGCVAAIAWHEAGHIIFILGCGGEVTGIHVQPFTRSAVTYNIPATASSSWIAASGILAGVTGGAALLVPLRATRNPYALPLVMAGVASWIGNGLYLVLGSTILKGFGDPGRMIAQGFPVGGLFTAGVCCVALGGLAFMRFLPLTGISPDMAILPRTGILLGGVFPYLAGIIIYNGIHDFPRLMRYCVFMAWILGLALLGSWMAGHPAARLFRGAYPVLSVRWPHAWTAAGLGIGVIAAALYAAGAAV